MLGSCMAFADTIEGSRTVIGADLDADDIAYVYKEFGISQGDVKELTVTNAEEREYLKGLVDESLIGTKSISCVYIEALADGKGLDVQVKNITWCTPDMYMNAMVTAGITDANVKIVAPFDVSGTAALTGIYKAYEDITGKKLDEDAKLVGTQELTVTAELAEEIGSADSAAIVNQLKLILDETKNMTDDQLREEIKKSPRNMTSPSPTVRSTASSPCAARWRSSTLPLSRKRSSRCSSTSRISSASRAKLSSSSQTSPTR